MANPGMHGGDRVCAIYAKKLEELGHKVNVITPKKKLLSIKQQIKSILKGGKWVSENKQRESHFDLLGVNVTYLENYSPMNGEELPDADVVMATWWKTAEWVTNFPLNKGVKVYFIQHLETHPWLPVERVRETYRMPFHKITIANWLVDEMENNFASKNISLVPNSVDLEYFFASKRAKQKTPTLGFLFSESGFKGVPIALEVIDKIKKKIPSLKVICFGSNKPRDITLPSDVEFILSPLQNEIRNIYSQCDVWLCCSLSEGFGLTILEAMACRTPSVSTKCGGPEDIIQEGENGYLCPIDDVKSLSKAAISILSFDEKKWSTFSNNAYEHAISYTWDDATKLLESALISAITTTRNDSSLPKS